MSELVFVEIGRVDEGSGALGTLVRFLTGMCAHMHH